MFWSCTYWTRFNNFDGGMDDTVSVSLYALNSDKFSDEETNQINPSRSARTAHRGQRGENAHGNNRKHRGERRAASTREQRCMRHFTAKSKCYAAAYDTSRSLCSVGPRGNKTATSGSQGFWSTVPPVRSHEGFRSFSSSSQCVVTSFRPNF